MSRSDCYRLFARSLSYLEGFSELKAAEDKNKRFYCCVLHHQWSGITSFCSKCTAMFSPETRELPTTVCKDEAFKQVAETMTNAANAAELKQLSLCVFEV
jgi:hypothetical protein